MKVAFTVVSCNPSNEGKTFVWKLSANTSVVAFGVTKTVKRTYYIGSMPVEVEVGKVIEEDIKRFDVVERVVKSDDGQVVTDDYGKPIVIKWLHVKPL